MKKAFDIFLGIRQRIWLTGILSLVTFWGYSISMLIAKRHEKTTGITRPLWFLLKYTFGIPFMFMNFAYNTVVGSFIFLELPNWGSGEYFFTDRLKRQKKSSDEEKVHIAHDLCMELNKTDSDHC